jgi:hypothetical protein
VNRLALTHIVSVPNHVRAWRTKFYHHIGGHNPKLPVADDYELIVRTALAGKIHHIPKMLYKQHINPGSAQRTKNAQIQELVPKIHDIYSEMLDAAFADPQENAEPVVVD